VLNQAFSAPFGTPIGEVVLAMVAALYIAGLAWLQRLGSIDAPARFLASRPARQSAGASTKPAIRARTTR
jgi:hypothetical protein